MKNMWQITVLLIACAVFCAGCPRQSSTKKSGKDSDSTRKSVLAEFKDDTVLLRIGTNNFTKADFGRLCSLRRKFLELANRQALQNMNSGVDASIVEMHMLDIYPSKTLTETVIRAYAATNGIAPLVTDREEARMLFQRGCQNELVPWVTFAKDFTGDAGKELASEIENAAILSAVRRNFFEKNKIVVSDEEMLKCKDWLTDYNARATSTNAVIWANASNVWQRIVKGEMTLEEAANKYSEDADDRENGEWAAFPLNTFSDEPELAKTIARMTPGDITPPIEGDNGLMILKLVGIEKPEKPTDPERYVLARVFFRLPEFYSVSEGEALKEEMLATKRDRAFAEFVEALTKSVKLEYVNGKEIFDRAHTAAQSPMSSIM